MWSAWMQRLNASALAGHFHRIHFWFWSGLSHQSIAPVALHRSAVLAIASVAIYTESIDYWAWPGDSASTWSHFAAIFSPSLPQQLALLINIMSDTAPDSGDDDEEKDSVVNQYDRDIVQDIVQVWCMFQSMFGFFNFREFLLDFVSFSTLGHLDFPLIRCDSQLPDCDGILCISRSLFFLQILEIHKSSNWSIFKQLQYRKCALQVKCALAISESPCC